MKPIVLLAALVVATAGCSQMPMAQQDRQKVVFQVSDADPATWNLALNNARNMYGGISFVDAGVVHIMKRQREGWSYVRP